MHPIVDDLASLAPPSRQIDFNVLEGTLVFRSRSARSSGGIKRNTRMRAVFDMSGAAGACLEVGGMGSLKFYGCPPGPSKSEAAATLSSARSVGDGIAEQCQRDERPCLDIPGYLPWMAVDVENDSTCFVIEISSSRIGAYPPPEAGGGKIMVVEMNDAQIGNGDLSEATGAESTIERSESKESEGDMDDDGVFAFWGGDAESEDEAVGNQSDAVHEEIENQVQRDLAWAVSKNKPFVKYAFKIQAKNNDKALWIAAFEKVGRLSEKSKRKKSIFGASSMTLVSSATQKNSRLRLRNALYEDAAPEKEYRVRPHHAYPHRWMTRGELMKEMDAPSAAVHDMRLSPAVATGRELGLLRVEVLQCLGLPRPKGKDPNAVVYLVCGSYAFSTDVIAQCRNPKWLSAAKRACAMPIYHGYVSLMAGVFHDDGSKNKDTFFGRVEVGPMAQLRPYTTYDVTLPLRQSTSVYNRKRLGALRLRIFLEYNDEWQIMLSYLPGRRNETGGRINTTVACADRKSFRNVALLVHGQHLPEKFSSEMFKAAVRELSLVLSASIQLSTQSLRDLMSWRNPLRSAYVFCGWMFLVYTNSIALGPAYVVGFVLLHLTSSYTYHVSSRHSDFRQPCWGKFLFAPKNGTAKEPHIGASGLENEPTPLCFRLLGFNGAKNGDKGLFEFPFASFAGYSKFSVSEALVSSGLDGFNEDEMGEDDADDDVQQGNDEPEPAASKSFGFSKSLPEQNINVKGPRSGKTIAQELQEVEGKVQNATNCAFEYHTYYTTDDQEPPFGKKVSGDKGVEDFKRELDKILGIGQFSTWNPVVGRFTSQFVPIIRILSVVLSIQRSLYNIFTWTDPILSLWLSIILIVGLMIFVFFPWRIAFLAFGLFFLGPQNWALRVARERFLSKERQMIPGRVLRACRELFKDDEGKEIWSSLNEGNHRRNGNARPQPLFRCHAPASNPIMERTTAGGAQHIVVPYSPLYFNRFYDWPPDLDHSRVLSVETSKGPLCPSSLNDVVSVRRFLHPLDRISPAKPDNVAMKSLSQMDDCLSQNPEINETSSKPESPTLLSMPLEDPQKPEEPNGVKNDVAPKKKKLSLKRRFAAHMTKKRQPALKKFNLTGKATTLAPSNVDSIENDATHADMHTLGENIPSIIETIYRGKESDGIKDVNGRTYYEESVVDNALVDKEGSEHVAPDVTEDPEARENEVKSGSGDASHHNMYQNIETDTRNIHQFDSNCNIEKMKTTAIERAGAASPSLSPTCPSTEDNNGDREPEPPMASDSAGTPSTGTPSAKEETSYNEESVCALKPSPGSDSTTLLHQLMLIKLELAAARTENDNYCMQLQEAHAERDMYKDKYEQVKKLGFTLVSPFSKNKNAKA